MRTSLRRWTSLAALALFPVAVLAAPASAAPVDVNLACQAQAPIIGPQETTINQGVDVTAPETVAPGGALEVVIDPAPSTVPAEVNGNTVVEINTFALRLPIPENSTFVSAELSGGAGLGDTPPELNVADGVATLSFPGPIAGGAEFELPTITAQLTAGDSGTIETRLAGTSYDDPGLTFITRARSIITANAPTSCFPDPSPVFSTTTIG